VIERLAFMPCRNHRILVAVLAACAGLVPPISPPAAAGIAQSGDHASYVLLAQGSDSTMMSGSTDDLARARARRHGREGLLYVRRGAAAYVIRDAATLHRAALIFEPQQALGARQAELGSRQAALGSRQAALGAEQARSALRQPSRAEELGRQQDVLGRQQDALGRQQDALGRDQDRLARQADAAFRALLDDAFRRGEAQRVD
jgi:bla regulator protein BlaR1